VKENTRFDTAQAEGVFGKQILVISLRMSWFGLVCLLLSNLLLCLGAGVVAYLMAGRVDLRVSVTSSVAGVLSYIEAVLFLVCKEDFNATTQNPPGRSLFHSLKKDYTSEIVTMLTRYWEFLKQWIAF